MSVALAIESGEMPATKDDLATFLEVLQSRAAHEWGMIPKQYRRYLTGGVPAEFAWLLERPELISALLVDSVRYRERQRQSGE